MSANLTKQIPASIFRVRSEIAAICRHHGVSRLELFGSATTDEFNFETSDYDFLVEFDFEIVGDNALENYFAFKGALVSLLGRPVDLVSYQRIRNPLLREHIDQQRIQLFAA